MEMVVGVLALQGAFTKHIKMLAGLGIKAIEVRTQIDLARCHALIIPGGESTTIYKQIKWLNLRDRLIEFSQDKPIFGTCAGLILMAHHIQNDTMTPFGLIDISVERNAFGRQAESFISNVEVNLETKKKKNIPAVFIRAPRIREYGPKVEILSTFQDEPILVKQGHFLGATFHPELTEEPAIHQYFIQMIKKQKIE